MILQNISRRVVGKDLITISPSNILPIMLWLGIFQQNCPAGFGRCEHFFFFFFLHNVSLHYLVSSVLCLLGLNFNKIPYGIHAIFYFVIVIL